ncbi:nucleotide-binding universal stress UspA family protein [Roseimicrobium gellanilyticum]|uniref:Nucleotide-binding universal stress UspA family protein n=1 Tax=Roseimicrobium gellanilyticum TaxID=748857 RepID=A0A366H5R3_9BACT|nr:universal stress protein [Roseimicrobium gellanilyticum]RBP37408.1 nucleotide-binding universal stress UspA family protein [Roseimicrobium gellanilyticum]
MKTYQHILVGVDFSPGSRAALHAAARIASPGKTPVTVMHVIDPKLAESMKEAHHWNDLDLFQHVDKTVVDFIADAGVPSDHLRIELDVGNAFQALIGARHRLDADLIVLGTRGSEHGPNDIGSVASKCMRKAPADVLLVREGMDGPFRHITACVDLSETSAKAVTAARNVAELDGAMLDCLLINQSVLALTMDYNGFAPPLTAVDPQGLAHWEHEMDGFLRPLMRTAPSTLTWNSFVKDRANVREGILEHMNLTKTDLVVLGTRGKTNLRTLLIGTTAEKVVTHAPCSMLTVKPDGFELPIEMQVETSGLQETKDEHESAFPPATVPMA